MKKVVALLFALFFCATSTVYAKVAPVFMCPPARVGYIFINTTGAIDNSEEAVKARQDAITEMLYSKNVEIIPSAESRLAAINYFEDTYVNHLTANRSDWQAIGKKVNADYFIVVKSGLADIHASGGFFDTSIKMTISTNVSIVDVYTGEYVLNEALTSKGKSSSVLGLGIPSIEHSSNKAFLKSLKDITAKVKSVDFKPHTEKF